MSSFSEWIQGEAARNTLLTAAVGVLALVIGHVMTKSAERQQARRALCADAFKAALGWREMLYRIRRRSGDVADDRALVEKFHKLQEDLDYYEGWLSTESLWLGRSYGRFVESVRTSCKTLIDEAWKCPVRKPSEGTSAGDKHPDIDEASRAFLFDLRAHFSPIWLPWLKVILIVRNVHWKPKA